MKKDICLTSYRISPVSDLRDNMVRHGRVVAHPASDFRLVWVDVREKMPDFIFHQNIVVNNSYVGHFIIASTERRPFSSADGKGPPNAGVARYLPLSCRDAEESSSARPRFH